MFTNNKLPLLLAACYMLYALLSWVLFFRDERALLVIGSRFYPQINDFLIATRQVLLNLKLNSWPTLAFAGLVFAAFYYYLKSLKLGFSRPTVIFWGIVFQAIVFFSYPVLSTDIFSYILSDRLNVVYSRNVWTTRPDEFGVDSYFGLADWTEKTRIYGGINQLIYSPVTAISGNDLVANVVSHKLVVIVFVILVMLILGTRVSPLIFWNPLFVLETAGSGHNDIIMLFFVILSILLFQKNKILFSAIALGLATQVKTTPVLLFVFLILSLLSELKIKKLSIFSAIYFLVVGIIYWFMDVNPFYTVTRTVGSVSVYWQSLPALIKSPLLNLGLLVLLGTQSVRVLIYRLNFTEVFVQTLTIYLLFFLAAFWNWYPIWVLVLLPFVASQRLKVAVIGFTASALLSYAILWAGYRVNYQSVWLPVIIYLTVLMGPVLGYVFYKKISV